MTDNEPKSPAWLMRDRVTMATIQGTMATIQGLRRQGITTAADIARALNDRGIPTPKGDRWHAMQVQRIVTMGTTRALNAPR